MTTGHAIGVCRAARRLFLAQILPEGEISAVASGLHRQKDGVKADSGQDDEGLLRVGKRRPLGGDGEGRQHQAEHDQRHDGAEIGVGPLQIIALLAVTPGADQQRQADHAIENDHDHGKERVPHERRVIVAMQHHRRNAHDFDESDRQRQDEGAVRLAEALGQRLGMAHDRHRRGQNNSKQPQEGDDAPCRMVEGREDAVAPAGRKRSSFPG